jgi:glycosyltransferase involved in cell wall biosynthesis
VFAVLEARTVTGPAKNLLELCHTLKDRRELRVAVALFDRGWDLSDFTMAADAAGVKVMRIREQKAFDLSPMRQLKEFIAAEDPDIVQTHSIKSHFLIYLSRVWKQRPWIAFHHGYTTTDLKMHVYNQFDRVSLRAPRRIVTVSQAFERQLTRLGIERSRIEVLHNSVSQQWAGHVQSLDRAKVRAELGIDPDERLLLAVGRMSKEKRHNDLLDAYRLLLKQGLKARLILVGDGPERAGLEAAGDPGVLFTGQIRDTAPYYAAADVLVLPSLTEGSPNVLLEAMAVGLPVVATAVGGVPEIVAHEESALLVEPLRPEALAGAVREMLEDGAKRARLVDKARDLVRLRHTPEARAQVVLGVYRGVMGGAKKGTAGTLLP